MCGLFFVLASGRSEAEVQAMVNVGLDAQRHRGPDGRGVAIVKNKDGVVAGIGHLRLSILDPRPESDQPLKADDGRSVLAFNGEIYNYKELRNGLAPRPLFERSVGDTATLLAGLADHGADFIPQLNGMWAYIYYDDARKIIQVSRDRLGIKPLFMYHEPGKLLLLSSEVKGILRVLGCRPTASAPAIAEYLVRGRTNHDEHSFFEDITTFPAGSWAEFPVSQRGLQTPPASQTFWVHPSTRPGFVDEPATPEEIRELFLDAVRLHLRADVPLAVTLSGGIDSTAIVSAARKLDPKAELVAMSAASRDPRTTEEPFQKIAAEHAGCDWRRVMLDDKIEGLFAEMPTISWHSDQPLKSVSDLALFELCRQARESGIIVMLNGQGADEQLCGYNKYLYVHAYEKVRCGNPLGAISTVGQFAAQGTVLNEFRLSEAKRYIPFMSRRGMTGLFGAGLTQAVADLEPLVAGGTVRAFERADMLHNSIPQLLHAEDRLSMSASTEMRVPFLDYRLVERLASMPAEQKLQRGWTKYLFRKAMEPLMPAAITWRRDKKGFALPLDAWAQQFVMPQLRRQAAEGLRIQELGLVTEDGVDRLEAAFKSGAVNGREVFRYLALETWLRRFDVAAIQ